jgi:hypothetical protein
MLPLSTLPPLTLWTPISHRAAARSREGLNVMPEFFQHFPSLRLTFLAADMAGAGVRKPKTPNTKTFYLTSITTA